MDDNTNTDHGEENALKPPKKKVIKKANSTIKNRSTEGRERYLDMVQRERNMLLDQGIARSTEQLLDMAGAHVPPSEI